MGLDLIVLGDRLFSLYRKIKIERIKDPNLVREFWNCDTVLKKETHYYFCNEVKEIEFEPLNNEHHGEITNETPNEH